MKILQMTWGIHDPIFQLLHLYLKAAVDGSKLDLNNLLGQGKFNSFSHAPVSTFKVTCEGFSHVRYSSVLWIYGIFLGVRLSKFGGNRSEQDKSSNEDVYQIVSLQ